MRKALKEKFKESLLSILPIAVLVVVLSLTLGQVGGFMKGPINGYMLGAFAIGTVMLILGMTLFALGSDIAMTPIGDSVGALLARTKKKSRLPLVFLIALVIGIVITLAEPDLTVLAQQLGVGFTLTITIAAGVGLFLAVAVMRIFFKWKLRIILIISYGIVFILAIILQFVNPSLLATAFDSGGVTTGPITVPFLLAFGLGISSAKKSSGSSESDGFGTVALCSVGPIIAVMIMGLFKISPGSNDTAHTAANISEMFGLFGKELLSKMGSVAIAVAPILVVFFIFQFAKLKLPKSQIIRIIIGMVYTYLGLTLFLTGVEAGFLPLGQALGKQIASLSYGWILIPIGVAIGALIVLAEPAIHVLKKQVEEVTGGAISKRVMLVSLCIGVSVAVGLSMLRVYTGISMWWFIAPVYLISLILMFFVPPMFTGIAFDSGGVASGPMTATFLLPFAIGAAQGLGGNVFTDAFGLVAFVAMAPLITIQLVGLIFKLKTRRLSRQEIKTALLLGEKELKLDINEDDFVIEIPEAADIGGGALAADIDLSGVFDQNEADTDADETGKTVDFDEIIETEEKDKQNGS